MVSLYNLWLETEWLETIRAGQQLPTESQAAVKLGYI